jgi:hypothetical protein
MGSGDRMGLLQVDFIRVPLPAARITTASSLKVSFPS